MGLGNHYLVLVGTAVRLWVASADESTYQRPRSQRHSASSQEILESWIWSQFVQARIKAQGGW